MNNNRGIKILGIGSFTPECVVTNSEFEQHIDTSDEWITTRTGIKERRFFFEGKNHEMAVIAAKNALADAKTSPHEIDFVIVATSTPDYYYPTISCLVANALGVENAGCADLAAACTGFLTALDLARSHLLSGDYKRILVIASEKLSSQTDFSDRASCVLFGDGAGAVVVEASDKVYASYIGSSPESIDTTTLFCKAAYAPNHPFSDHISETAQPNYLNMDGTAVYKFAVEAMPKAATAAMQKADIEVGDIDLIIPHQANLRIIKTAVKTLRIPMDKVFVNIDKRGNTSSACIPTALDELKQSGRLERGMKICLVAFGAGLTYGSVCLEY